MRTTTFHRLYTNLMRTLALGVCTALVGTTVYAGDIVVWSAGAAQTPLSILIHE